MYQVTFRTEVKNDSKTAYDWNEMQRLGLGKDFLLTLEASYAEIARMPTLYQTIYKMARRKLVRRFSYSIYFVIRGKVIVLLAVLHIKRDPKVREKRT